ncbi:MAG TPA: DUF1285 domain-containing protein [Azospirillaceae bacterium]|nr:DUF1285 domain-containing protein [Azospirillaceae bacterium]
MSAKPDTSPSSYASLGPADPEKGFDIRIDREGVWWHEGGRIERLALVKLFSTVLRKDEKGRYWLVTPVERGTIEVEDAPFVAVALTVEGSGRDQVLRFRTNLDQEVEAGPDRPIRVETDPGTGEPRPYILVRDNLEARINRPVFYELVERGVAPPDAGTSAHQDESDQIGIWSKGTFFPLGSLRG